MYHLHYLTCNQLEWKAMYIPPVLKSCCACGVETGVESNILYTDVYLPRSNVCCTCGIESDIYLPRSKACFPSGTERNVAFPSF